MKNHSLSPPSKNSRKQTGIVTVLAGAMLGGTIEPELTLGADFLPGQAPLIDQSVFWKDKGIPPRQMVHDQYFFR